jgi:hypothetical protein
MDLLHTAFGKFAPGDHANVAYIFLPPVTGIAKLAVRSDAKVGDGNSACRLSKYRVLREIARDHDRIDLRHL